MQTFQSAEFFVRLQLERILNGSHEDFKNSHFAYPVNILQRTSRCFGPTGINNCQSLWIRFFAQKRLPIPTADLKFWMPCAWRYPWKVCAGIEKECFTSWSIITISTALETLASLGPVVPREANFLALPTRGARQPSLVSGMAATLPSGV